MDRLELKQHLRAAGVPEDCYLLVGLDPPRSVREGACIVRPNQHSWEVLVWSPVDPHPVLTFANEDEACEHLLNSLIAVPAVAGRGPLAESAVATAPSRSPSVGPSLAPARADVAKGRLVPQEA
jgi:hypothetical protein